MLGSDLNVFVHWRIGAQAHHNALENIAWVLRMTYVSHVLVLRVCACVRCVCMLSRHMCVKEQSALNACQ